MFNTTTKNKDTEGIFRKSADGIKLGRVGDMLEGKVATPIDFNNLEKCAGRKDVIFKGKVLNLLKSPHGPLQAGLCLARKQLCWKGPESMNKLNITQKNVPLQ